MKSLVDVVNFNADASCLSCRKWLEILQGGNDSVLFQWLNLYVTRNRKVVLGFPGATVSDLVTHNPEAIVLINSYPDIFEIIHRPFSHDISLLRGPQGFIANVDYGLKVVLKEFINISNYFLPPEFMLTNEQIGLLGKLGVDGVFINPSRFASEIGSRIPEQPYRINGVLGSSLNCIPFAGRLTNSYLHALQEYDCRDWNGILLGAERTTVFSWRDGESSFFLPDGLKREAYWLENEDVAISRKHLSDVPPMFTPNEDLEESQYHSYPVHSFVAWMKEFRMLGFINRVQRIEENIALMSHEQVHYWLMIINSDILSAVEKRSPVVHLSPAPGSLESQEYTIKRRERGYEGEEFLALFDQITATGACPGIVEDSSLPHLIKWRGRIDYLKNLGPVHTSGLSRSGEPTDCQVGR